MPRPPGELIFEDDTATSTSAGAVGASAFAPPLLLGGEASTRRRPFSRRSHRRAALRALGSPAGWLQLIAEGRHAYVLVMAEQPRSAAPPSSGELPQMVFKWASYAFVQGAKAAAITTTSSVVRLFLERREVSDDARINGFADILGAPRTARAIRAPQVSA